MKFVKLSSVLLALFFAVGCANKSVEKDGNTTATTTAPQEENTAPDEEVVGNSDGEEYAMGENAGGKGYPEGGFMPDGAVSGDGDGSGGSSDPYGTDSQDPYASGNNGSEDGEYGMSQGGDVDESYADGMLKLNSLATIYFDFDRYDIRQDMKEYVRANAEFIKEQDIKAIVLQGNTDEFGGDEYNTALGLKRAISVRDALVLQGLPRNMFSTISYGMHKPVCKEKTAECYAKNRRTDLVEKQ